MDSYFLVLSYMKYLLVTLMVKHVCSSAPLHFLMAVSSPALIY